MSLQKGKYLASNIDDSVVVCGETIGKKTVPTTFNKKG